LFRQRAYFFHVGVDFSHFEFELFDIIVEHANTVLDLLVAEVSQLCGYFIEVGTYDAFGHLILNFF
jgi:hypothetical protein